MSERQDEERERTNNKRAKQHQRGRLGHRAPDRRHRLRQADLQGEKQAKKRRWQAEKEELKQYRTAASSKAKGDGKSKDGALKSKDQGGGDLCFSWDSGKGTCADCSPGTPARARSRASTRVGFV